MDEEPIPADCHPKCDRLSPRSTDKSQRTGKASFEIGGPDIARYGDLMLRYARIRGLKRGMFLLPGIPLWFMAFGVGSMTPVPYPIAYALIGGLSADSVVRHPPSAGNISRSQTN